MKSGPKETVGVLGGGQLGRMLALEARRMGRRIVSWTDAPLAGPVDVADLVITEPFDSESGLKQFLKEVDVATVEFENIPFELLEAIEAEIRLAPSSKAVAICQNREREKGFLSANGIPCADYSIVDSADTLATALDRLPHTHGILKTAEFGYDGKGQRTVHRDDDAQEIWKDFGCPRAVIEERVELAGELSVLVVRDDRGSVLTYEPAENFHHNHILDLSVIPARYPEEILTHAQEIALGVAEALSYEGIMAVEFFLAKDGRVLVNEMAPRPHNSGHHTLDACETSQFEQQLRVASGLHMGGTATITPSVMWNLLGDLWPSATVEPDWSAILSSPGANLHLYGKDEARPGRKMGHVTFTARTVKEALAQAEGCREAYEWLS